MHNFQKKDYLRDFNTIPASMDSVLFMNYIVEHFLGRDACQRNFHEDTTFNEISSFKIIEKYNNKVKSNRDNCLNHIRYKKYDLPSQEAVNLLIRYFLGEDWYVVDSLSVNQVNSIAFIEIKRMYKGQMRYMDWVKLKKQFK